MKTSDAGIALLKQFEGCKLTAYRLDGEKYYTIGYGHYGPDVTAGMKISAAQAEAMLRVDLEKYEGYVTKYVTEIPLTQNRFDALVSYTYNRGAGGIKQLAENCHTVAEYSAGFLTYWGSAERYKTALLARRAKERALFDKAAVSDEMKEITVMENTADKVIAVAEAEVGYLEKSTAAYRKNPAVLDRKTDGAGSDNYTKYGRDMHAIYPKVMDFPAPWCDCFVDWCFYKAYGIANAKKLLCGDFDDYTVASAQLYMNKKAYIYRASGRPEVGDQIFFHNGTRICHTGLVYAVDAKHVYTIEGNTSGNSGVVANGGGVFRKTYDLTNVRIHGYGRPAYDKAAQLTAANKAHVPLTYQTGGTYFANTDLNIRKTPDSSGKNNLTGKILSRTTGVKALAVTDTNGKIWVQIGSEMWVCADSGVKTYLQDTQV